MFYTGLSGGSFDQPPSSSVQVNQPASEHYTGGSIRGHVIQSWECVMYGYPSYSDALGLGYCVSCLKWVPVNFRFSPCILTVSHFYYPTNALNYI